MKLKNCKFKTKFTEAVVFCKVYVCSYKLTGVFAYNALKFTIYSL